MTEQLQAAIEAAWEDRANVTPASDSVREVVEAALELLDSGQARETARPENTLHQWRRC